MSVARINQFQAHPGKGDKLREFLISFMPAIKASPGCESCQLLRSNDNPDRLVVLEVWDSVESHKASVRDIPPATIEKFMAILVNSPKGGYYNFAD